MAGLDMQHRSRPGYYGTPLSAAAEARLGLVADLMIPPAASWPRASDLVPRFVSERIDGGEGDALEALLESIEGLPPQEVEAWLHRLEAERAEVFAELRTWVYYGYYSSGSVIDVLDGLNGYHGAPQPLGYEIAEDPRLPARPRGSYRATDEVVDVLR